MKNYLGYAMGLALMAEAMNKKNILLTDDQKPYKKSKLSNKQVKSRKKSKLAKQSRKRCRK